MHPEVLCPQHRICHLDMSILHVDGILNGRCISLARILAPSRVWLLWIAQLLDAANPPKPRAVNMEFSSDSFDTAAEAFLNQHPGVFQPHQKQWVHPDRLEKARLFFHTDRLRNIYRRNFFIKIKRKSKIHQGKYFDGINRFPRFLAYNGPKQTSEAICSCVVQYRH